jgi:hypothetical protein
MSSTAAAATNFQNFDVSLATRDGRQFARRQTEGSSPGHMVFVSPLHDTEFELRLSDKCSNTMFVVKSLKVSGCNVETNNGETIHYPSRRPHKFSGFATGTNKSFRFVANEEAGIGNPEDNTVKVCLQRMYEVVEDEVEAEVHEHGACVFRSLGSSGGVVGGKIKPGNKFVPHVNTTQLLGKWEALGEETQFIIQIVYADKKKRLRDELEKTNEALEELLKKKARLEEDLREDKYPQPHLF